jgi:hypothetical protein
MTSKHRAVASSKHRAAVSRRHRAPVPSKDRRPLRRAVAATVLMLAVIGALAARSDHRRIVHPQSGGAPSNVPSSSYTIANESSAAGMPPSQPRSHSSLAAAPLPANGTGRESAPTGGRQDSGRSGSVIIPRGSSPAGPAATPITRVSSGANPAGDRSPLAVATIPVPLSGSNAQPSRAVSVTSSPDRGVLPSVTTPALGIPLIPSVVHGIGN